MGHLAIGLLAAAPAWFVWDGRVSLAFVAFVVSTVMLPDVDLVLRLAVPGVEHHGVTHTFVFILLVAVVAGVVAARGLAPHIERWWLRSEGHFVPRGEIYGFVTGGLVLGGASHVFADMLSAPDIAPPVSPLWPFVTEPISFDVIFYSSIWWNLGLLLVAGCVHAVLAYRDGLPALLLATVGRS